MALYAVLALSATARSLVQLGTKASEAPVAYTLSAVAALVYIAATYGLARPGVRATRVAWWACSFELVGVYGVGLLTLVDAALFPDQTVWSDFGLGYGFLPAVLPVLGLAWLWRTSTGSRPMG